MMRRLAAIRMAFMCMTVYAAVHAAVQADVRPNAERLDAVVEQLGAEPHGVRQEAFEQLEAFTVRFPRFMLLELADRYGVAKDLEVRFRLESLLRPLAGRYLFSLPSGFIGINMEWASDDEGRGGIRVLSVLPGHAGEEAGLLQGDVIRAVDEVTVEAMGSLQSFSDTIAGNPPGTILRFELLRGEEKFVTQFALDARPEHLEAQARDGMERVQTWLRGISGQADAEDPTFPIGHFPMDEE